MEFTEAELAIIKRDLVPGSQGAKIMESKSNRARTMWNAYCSHYGLKPEQFGQIFRMKRRDFQIVGINPTASRFTVEVRRLPDGKPFRVPHNQIGPTWAAA